MYIQKIHIENFRLLKNVDIVLDKSLTLIVGKNNTGKTSVAHLLQSTRCGYRTGGCVRLPAGRGSGG